MKKKEINKELLMKQVTTLEAAKAALKEECDNDESTMDLEAVGKILEEKETDLYLTSLGNVKPIYLNNSDARAGYGFAKANIEMAAEELAAYEKSPWLKKDEIVTLRSRLERLQSTLQQTIKDIRLLVTDGKVTMNNNDRLDMLAGIEEHVEIAGNYLLAIFRETNALIAKRQQQKAREEKLETA
ncbi:hypothetical protein Q4E93_20730 [Flavitalea sp. BT771]|uniref:hypothetical protein n=1 Tax=Flavitalea sp. BT771 TaxID=3063329 RepID=UPI0026E1E6CC|nr:hypothetical protein [Flavitalea sp. BT771]MDO6433046.1 hypothetical protein [Flavitalea sp. BT771]MDV6221678.1 hypothetical protein [Flavitalea sp. BT771]